MIHNTGFKRYVNRSDVNNNNGELPNAFYWDIEIIRWPSVVYYPGDRIFKGRLVSVSGIPQLTHSPEEVEGPGAFKILQVGEVDHGNATLTLTFQDFDDQLIKQCIFDWINCCQSARYKHSYKKSEVVGDINIYQLNSELKPIGKYMFETCMVGNSGDDTTDFGNKKESKGKLGLEIRSEFWDYEKLN